MIPVQARLNDAQAQWQEFLYQFGCDMRVAMPGIIQSLDTSNGITVTVRPAITEMMVQNGVLSPLQLPDLPGVKLGTLSGGGLSMTLPVQQGDECWLIFADMCIDAAWQSGGVQNQIDKRRHDLSDAICIPLRWSIPKAISNYSTDSIQIRTDDGLTVIDVKSGTVTVTAQNIAVNGSSQIELSAPVIGAQNGGTALPLMNDTFYQWWVANIFPFLQAKGYTGPPVPTGSETTILKGQ